MHAAPPQTFGAFVMRSVAVDIVRPLGYVTPVLYQTVGTGSSGATVGSLGCTDVVQGNNKTAHAGGYSAGPGYDAVSGWGTPNGLKLAAALAQALP
jgi:kumamolisin